MSNSLNDKRPGTGINIDKITTFCKKNVKYISAGVLTVALVVVLAIATTNSGKEDKQQEEPKAQQEQTEADAAETEEETNEAEAGEYEVDAVPEVNELVSSYYTYYAGGKLKKLNSITESLSDMEKSYIKMMKKYVGGYKNITCYTKDGLDKGSYMVSVTFDMEFDDVKGTLPGMDFFYVRTNEDGALYIDNLYSSFNRQIKEQETDPEIDALIESFEAEEDVQQLRQEFQDKYDKAVAADEDLQKMADTIAEAIREWVNSYTSEDTKEEQTEENTDGQAAEQQEEEPQQEEPAQTEEPQQEQQETDNTDEQENSTGINYVPEGTVLTANDGYNVRVSMSETAELVGTTAVGDSIKVVLSYAEGWTKVEWNGQTGYIKTELLLNN